MGIFPGDYWLYYVGFGILAAFGLLTMRLPDSKRIRYVIYGVIAVSILAIIVSWFTGMTFRLNTAAPVPADRYLYLLPTISGPPDSGANLDLLAMRERDGVIAWRYPVGYVSGLYGVHPRFINDDRRVYLERIAVPFNNTEPYVVNALDARTGHELWRVNSDIGGQLTETSNGQLLIHNDTATLALDVSTGKELQRLAETPTSLGVMAGGVNYVCDPLANTITAQDASSGQALWQYSSPSAPKCDFAATSEALIVHIGSALVALQATNGARIWQKTLPKLGDYSSLYGAADDVVVAVTADAVVALRTNDGKQLWSFPADIDSDPHVIAVTDNLVILRHISGQVIALDLHTGAVYWQASV